MSETGNQIAVFMIILGVISPVFTYAFMNVSMDQDYQGELTYLSKEDLLASRIYIEGDERHTITFSNYVEFVNLSQPFRVKWVDELIHPDKFVFYTEVFPSDWIFKKYHAVHINDELYNFEKGGVVNYKPVTNQTIVLNFNTTGYNWTRASARSLGYEMFFTCEKYDNNITQAIASGELNITIGRAISTEEYDPDNLASFYWGLVSGRETYGLPDSLSWLFRLQGLLIVFAGGYLIKDLLPFV